MSWSGVSFFLSFLFEIQWNWATCFSANYDEQLLAKYTESGGNARDFVWKGILSSFTSLECPLPESKPLVPPPPELEKPEKTKKSAGGGQRPWWTVVVWLLVILRYLFSMVLVLIYESSWDDCCCCWCVVAAPSISEGWDWVWYDCGCCWGLLRLSEYSRW